MAKYVLLGAATVASGDYLQVYFIFTLFSVSAYYGYKYFQIYKVKLHNFVNNLVRTVEDTRATLHKVQIQLKHLENVKAEDERDLISKSFTNGEFSSFVTVTNESPPNEQEKLTQFTDPYVSDVVRLINNVRKEAEELEERVKYYKGTAGDRVYKQFNEKLIRMLISLDRIDVKGHDVLKEEKQDAIEYLKGIQAVLKTR